MDPQAGCSFAYSWSFGDGASGTGPTVTHTYSKAGSGSLHQYHRDPRDLRDGVPLTWIGTIDRGGELMGARRTPDEHGQALVEFSLAIVVFLMLMMGVFDFGRAIYQYNGVAQAAREIARVTAVHPGADFTTTAGRSTETKAVIATQKGLIPNLGDPTIRVRRRSPGRSSPDLSAERLDPGADRRHLHPITPLLGLVGTWTLFSSSTSSQLQ